MSDDQKRQLQTHLWNIADELRGKMDADEFRDYILGFIFYKYLSEKIHLYATDLLKKDKLAYENIDESTTEGAEIISAVQEEAIDKLGYFLKPTELFHYLAVTGASNPNLIEELEKILNSIQNSTLGQDSEEDFDNLFSEVDLNSQRLGRTVAERSKLIGKVLLHLDKIDFKLEDANVDILGDAYEYLIGQFASGAGKKAGEFYTPQEVSQILARLVTNGKTKLKNVYDPACGSGSLLLRVAKYVQDVGSFYGQEMNNTTYNLARMNMILHDIHFDRFDIRQEDTLEKPQHLQYKFEAIVANPPFSAKWSADPLFLQDDRFNQYGKLAPSSKADYAFIQHMIYQLDENGTMAVVMPHGVLFRGGAEGYIREFLIREKNYLDAVIGLPANLFYGTSIPASILVFKKCRENTDNILFIDASKHFEKGKNQNKLSQKNIDKIIDTYSNRAMEEKYSYVAPISEVKGNEYNLNIPRYVDTF
jgi:type I restriction enzyme M protein